LQCHECYGRERFNVHLFRCLQFCRVVAPPQCMAGHSTSEVETTPPFRNARTTTPSDMAPYFRRTKISVSPLRTSKKLTFFFFLKNLGSSAVGIATGLPGVQPPNYAYIPDRVRCFSALVSIQTWPEPPPPPPPPGGGAGGGAPPGGGGGGGGYTPPPLFVPPSP